MKKAVVVMSLKRRGKKAKINRRDSWSYTFSQDPAS